MSWKDNLKSSLGLNTLIATMIHRDGDIERYILKNDGLYQSENRQQSGFTPNTLVYLSMNHNSGRYHIVSSIGNVTMDRQNVMDFLNYWADSGYYKVTVNGKEILVG